MGPRPKLGLEIVFYDKVGPLFAQVRANWLNPLKVSKKLKKRKKIENTLIFSKGCESIYIKYFKASKKRCSEQRIMNGLLRVRRVDYHWYQNLYHLTLM